MGNIHYLPPSQPIIFTANQSMALYKFRLGIMHQLLKDGFEVIAIAPKDVFSEKLVAEGIRFIPVQLGTHDKNPFDDMRFFIRLIALYRQLKPCMVFHYTIKPNIYGNLAARLAGNIPTVSVVPGRGCTFHQGNWLFTLVKLMYRMALRYTQEVWFLNDEDRDFFVEEGMVASSKTAVLPGEGVDTGFYQPRHFLEMNNNVPFTFLLSGRMLWEKGVGEFVAAARLVRQQYPSTRFHLLGFLDSGDNRVVPVQQIQEWVAEGTVSFMGVAQDVRPYFGQANCFVLPSYYGEGVPRTLLEAASMEIPLITSDHRGCRRAVKNGVNGLLCQPKDAEDLAGKMLQLIKMHPEKRRQMGSKGRQLVQSEFEEKLLVEIYYNKLKELMNSKSPVTAIQAKTLFTTV